MIDIPIGNGPRSGPGRRIYAPQCRTARALRGGRAGRYRFALATGRFDRPCQAAMVWRMSCGRVANAHPRPKSGGWIEPDTADRRRPDGADPEGRQPAGGGAAHDRPARSGQGSQGATSWSITELALTTFFPRWYMTDQAEVDAWFEREMPNAATRPLFERAAEHQHRHVVRLCGADRRRPSLQHRRSWSSATARSSASTARCICRAIPSSIRSARSSTWRSATSSPAISASRLARASAASSACASATTGAGRRPIASWDCRASN